MVGIAAAANRNIDNRKNNTMTQYLAPVPAVKTASVIVGHRIDGVTNKVNVDCGPLPINKPVKAKQ